MAPFFLLDIKSLGWSNEDKLLKNTQKLERVTVLPSEKKPYEEEIYWSKY